MRVTRTTPHRYVGHHIRFGRYFTKIVWWPAYLADCGHISRHMAHTSDYASRAPSDSPKNGSVRVATSLPCPVSPSAVNT
jgi:hypothetical protein